MKDFGETLASVLVAIVVVAIVAVLVSQAAKTTSVVDAFARAFGNIMGVIVRPVGGSGGAQGTVGSGQNVNPFQLPGATIPSIIGPQSGPFYG